MPPKPKALDWPLILSVAREVAETERVPSRAKVANRLGIVHSTLNKRAREDGMANEIDEILGRDASAEPGAVEQHTDGSLTIVSEPVESSPWTPETLLKAHGFALDEWEVVRARANRWGDPAEPRHQLRIDVVPVSGIIKFPDPSNWTPPPRPRKRKHEEPEKVVIVSDHHCPLRDDDLHACFLQWLADEQPDTGIINGDLGDFPSISRHRSREGFTASVNECLESMLNTLLDYRQASPDTRWTINPGNHDAARLQNQLLDNAPGMHGIKVAGDDIPALSLRRLLRLDELGIEIVDGDWDMAKIRLSRKLSVRHGPATGKNATQKLLDKFSVSVIQGHTHRLSMLYRTEHSDEDDEPVSTRMAAECGCMCQVHEGLGYSDSPNWNQGFLVAHIWDDGDFHAAPAPYVNGRLLAPSGKRYRP